MKVTLESTDKFATINGARVRIWEGQTESGIPVVCFIAKVGTSMMSDVSQFQRELTEHRLVSIQAQQFVDTRMVFDDD